MAAAEKKLVMQLETVLPLKKDPFSVSEDKKIGLVIMDEVNGFVKVDGGNMAPKSSETKIVKMVGETVQLAQTFANKDWPILAFVTAYSAGKPQPPYPSHCVMGTGEENLVPELRWLEKQKGATIVKKDCINGYIGAAKPDGSNTFVKWTTVNRLDSILVVGMCTDVAVMEFVLTVMSARNHGLLGPLKDIYVYSEGCATYSMTQEKLKGLGLDSNAVHPQELTNYLGLYFMAARGAHLIQSIDKMALAGNVDKAPVVNKSTAQVPQKNGEAKGAAVKRDEAKPSVQAKVAVSPAEKKIAVVGKKTTNAAAAKATTATPEKAANATPVRTTNATPDKTTKVTPGKTANATPEKGVTANAAKTTVAAAARTAGAVPARTNATTPVRTTMAAPAKPAVAAPAKPAAAAPAKPAAAGPAKPAVAAPAKPAVVTPPKTAVATPPKPAVAVASKPTVAAPPKPTVAAPPKPTVAALPKPAAVNVKPTAPTPPRVIPTPMRTRPPMNKRPFSPRDVSGPNNKMPSPAMKKRVITPLLLSALSPEAVANMDLMDRINVARNGGLVQMSAQPQMLMQPTYLTSASFLQPPMPQQPTQPVPTGLHQQILMQQRMRKLEDRQLQEQQHLENELQFQAASRLTQLPVSRGVTQVSPFRQRQDTILQQAQQQANLLQQQQQDAMMQREYPLMHRESYLQREALMQQRDLMLKPQQPSLQMQAMLGQTQIRPQQYMTQPPLLQVPASRNLGGNSQSARTR